MSKYIGRRIAVGLGKESSRGTAVAATHWQPHNDLTFDEKVEYAPIEAGFGTIAKQNDKHIVARYAEGEIGGPIYDKPFGLILYSLLGTLNSAAKSAPNAAVYDHTFTLAETAQHQAITISTDEANGDYRYALGMVEELEISYELGKVIEYKAKIKSLKGASATNTPAFATDMYPFRPQDFVLKLASATAGLSGASATSVRDFKIVFKSPVERDMVLGSTDPSDFNNTEFSVEGEMTLVYNDETIKNYALANTQRAMSITLTNAGQTIGSSSNPALVITLDEVVFDDYSRDKKLGDLVTKTVKFSANFDTTVGRIGNVVLTNLATSY